MNKDAMIQQELKKIGAPDDLIAQYQRYLDSGNRQGQERLLCRFRAMQSETLRKDREKLACLDYIIAKVERTGELFENR